MHSPFDIVKQVLSDLVNVDNFVSGEGEVDAAPQSHLPQLLRGLVRIQAAVAQEEPNCEKDSRHTSHAGWVWFYCRLWLLLYELRTKLIA